MRPCSNKFMWVFSNHRVCPLDVTAAMFERLTKGWRPSSRKKAIYWQLNSYLLSKLLRLFEQNKMVTWANTLHEFQFFIWLLQFTDVTANMGHAITYANLTAGASAKFRKRAVKTVAMPATQILFYWVSLKKGWPLSTRPTPKSAHFVASLVMKCLVFDPSWTLHFAKKWPACMPIRIYKGHQNGAETNSDWFNMKLEQQLACI